jgi:uncharacterized coiled-coil protein SlyX
MCIQLRSKEGIFRVEKDVTLFQSHTTIEELNEVLAAVKKEITKLSKQSEVTVDVLSMDSDYNRTDKCRIILRGEYRGVFVVDVRKFNGYDYSDSTEYNFVNVRDLLKYTMKTINEYANSIMGNLPEEHSYYSQELESNRENLVKTPQ